LGIVKRMDSEERNKICQLIEAVVEAAVVDGRVDPQERALLLASAATLGIEATALEERIAWRLRATREATA
jgi:uncharacterized membrane protein YebE (DUF533 family)